MYSNSPWLRFLKPVLLNQEYHYESIGVSFADFLAMQLQLHIKVMLCLSPSVSLPCRFFLVCIFRGLSNSWDLSVASRADSGYFQFLHLIGYFSCNLAQKNELIQFSYLQIVFYIYVFEQREKPGTRSKGAVWPSGGQHVGRQKADGIGEHPGGPATETQVGIYMHVYEHICVCARVHACIQGAQRLP